MKVFTHVPVGLGLSHREHETRAAMVWNRITADGSSPDTWFIATKIEIESFNYPLAAGSMISMGIIEEKDGLYRLSKRTIEKIETYLSQLKKV